MNTIGYVFHFQGHGVFGPNGKVPIPEENVDKHNKQVEYAELAYVATHPDTIRAYTDDTNTISTWLGTHIGTIYYKRSYRNSLGDYRTTLWVSIGNCQYWGTEYQNSQYVKFHKVNG